jgi:hypothetical protein
MGSHSHVRGCRWDQCPWFVTEALTSGKNRKRGYYPAQEKGFRGNE